MEKKFPKKKKKKSHHFLSSSSSFAQPYHIRAYILYFNFDWRTELILRRPSEIGEGRWFRFFRRNTTKVAMGIYFLVLLVTIILTAIGYKVGVTDPSTYYLPEEQDCQPTFIKAVVGIQAVVFTILIIVEFVVMHRVRDDFAFKWELLTTCVIGIPVLIVWLLARFNAKVGAVAPPYVWPVIAFLVCAVASVTIPMVHIIKNRRKLRHGDSGSFVSMEVIPNNPNSNAADFLLQVLDSPVLLESLQVFMVTNWSVENLLFLMEVRQFQSQKDSPEKLQEEATRIYDFFLAPLSMFEVNLDMEDREKIMEEIQAQRATLSIFDVAKVKVFNIIKHDSLPRWRSTSQFESAWQKYNEEKEAA